MKGATRFGKLRKLSPLEIVERIDKETYRLA